MNFDQTKVKDCVAQLTVMVILLGILTTVDDETNVLYHKNYYITNIGFLLIGKDKVTLEESATVDRFRDL